MLRLVAGDTESTLKITCKDSDGTVINLTGATVRVYWRIANGNVQSRTMTIDASPATGIATYKFQSGDLIVGDLVGEIEIQFTSGTILTSVVTFTINVRLRTFGTATTSISRVVVINAITFQAVNGYGGALVLGTPVYLSASGVMQPALAVGETTSDVEGMITDATVANNTLGTIITEGIITGTVAQWASITGNQNGLVSSMDYYLSPVAAGKLVDSAYSFIHGQVVMRMGSALSATAFKFEIGERIYP